jgi:hypothetical protein
MEPAQYTNPLEDALSHGSQRVAQVASLAAAMAQVVMQHRAMADAQKALPPDTRAAKILNEQTRLLNEQARMAWAPAHDRRWLTDAGIVQTARAWAAAATHAPTNPSAASAMRKCEEHLRTLHPHAMARYDRLRHDGMPPLDAMRDTAPLFGHSPTTRPGDPAPHRSALETGSGQTEAPSADHSGDVSDISHASADNHERTELRGRQIVERLQARARAAGHPAPGPDELAMILETATNLPTGTIDRLTHNPPAPVPPDPAADKSPAKLAAQNFPHTAAEAVQTVATNSASATKLTPRKAPAKAHQPRRSL